jgi:hypothetical protein
MSDLVDFEVEDGQVVYVPRDAVLTAGFIHASDLVGVSELAALFGVGKSTISGWGSRRASNGMPEPVAELATGPVFDGAAVVRWWKGWKPRKGRRAGSLPDGV